MSDGSRATEESLRIDATRQTVVGDERDRLYESAASATTI